MSLRPGVSGYLTRRRMLLGMGVLWALLALGLIVVWVDSCWRYRSVEIKSNYGRQGASVVYGVVNLVWDNGGLYANYPVEWIWSVVPVKVLPDWKELFRFERRPFVGLNGFVDVRFPIGAVFVILSALSAATFWRRARLFPRGHCRNCGYNLFGNTSGRCPECGIKAPTVLEAPEPLDAVRLSRGARLGRAAGQTVVGLAVVCILIWLVTVGWAWQISRLTPTNVLATVPSLMSGRSGTPPATTRPIPTMVSLTRPLPTTMNSEVSVAVQRVRRFLVRKGFSTPETVLGVTDWDYSAGGAIVIIVDPPRMQMLVSKDGAIYINQIWSVGGSRPSPDLLFADDSTDAASRRRLSRAMMFIAMHCEPNHDPYFDKLGNIRSASNACMKAGVWYLLSNPAGREIVEIPICLDPDAVVKPDSNTSQSN